MQRPPYTEVRPVAVMDTECFPNYWAIAFKEVGGTRIKRFRKWNDRPLDVAGIAAVFKKWRVVTYNGINYDMNMVALAMSGADNATLKRANDSIILAKLRPWHFEEMFKVKTPGWIDHIDLFEVHVGSPGKPSLKLLGGRLHSRKMHELELPFDTVIETHHLPIVDDYHDDDLILTEDLWIECSTQVRLRAIFSEKFGVDLRSKSDAQCAEAVFKAVIEKKTGRKIRRPEVEPGSFNYKAPAYIKFKTPALQELLRRITTDKFVIQYNGKVDEPEWLKTFQIPLGNTLYSIGIGGIHSTEHCATHVSDDEHVLLDRDVTSYYPSLILACRLFPPALGEIFLRVLQDFVTQRMTAKAKIGPLKDAGKKDEARPLEDLVEFLKILLNGIFGKFGQAGSIFFGPESMVGITLTGQLSALMAIETNELDGLPVVSANTDGWITKVPRERIGDFMAHVFDWECETGLKTEQTEIKALHSRDVNNYLAITASGEVKRKGKLFAPAGPGLKGAAGMKKNPQTEICMDAVIAFLTKGVPLRKTIFACDDIRKFVAIQKVDKGGGAKDGVKLGKAIRWYYSTETQTAIHHAVTGNTISSTMGAVPCMNLPDDLPEDIDYDWYVVQATAILEDVGLHVEDPAMQGRTRPFLARLAKQKTYHIVDPTTRAAICGKRPLSLRERWIETSNRIPEGMRICTKCNKGNDV